MSSRDLPETTQRAIADLPRHGNPVRLVWARLADLEQTGQDASLIAALRMLLLQHQPPRYGRCRACPRTTWRTLWRRPRWPCLVWRRVHFALLGHGHLGL
jgi:hypothetical protein